ncbi:polysaccharide pyruvyl transferase family protein [Labilibaculum sp. DW002]|uniref:Polysaccharide pyruvyl transferase family protein n=1 Tax=Paralabilibaculum antarcticum TaxID=2912572 RepID=A0ABT5VQ49_9BACT|nr:polysaccharide pyruvyl transferase family protein [Labilibaculum sp. DW002]MDE5417561.1 polysaccharide pyruvyl transferase family protein [Labilibaculum sp. DW002]
MIKKAKNYYRRAYTMGHFPSLLNVLFNKHKLFAYYGFLGDGNFGDELVYEATKSVCYPNKLIPLQKHMPILLKFYCLFFSNRISGIIVGGGTLFRKFGGNKKYYLRLIEEGKSVFIHGTGADKNIVDDFFWKSILATNEVGGVRGPLSQKNMRKIGLELPIVGDAAFSLHNKRVEKRENHLKKSIIINFGTHTKDSNLLESRNEILNFIAEKTEEGYLIKFLPFHYIDLELSIDLVKDRNQVIVLDIPNNYEEALSHFEDCTFALGERLHFNIMAALAACPFISINYDLKHVDFLESLGLSEAGLSIHEVSKEKLHKCFLKRNTSFDWRIIDQRINDLKREQFQSANTFNSNIKA